MEIRSCREKVGIAQGELAKKVGVTQQYLCCLERGKKNNPSLKLLAKIAEALNVPITDLLKQKAG